jgi:hypothetical protein
MSDLQGNGPVNENRVLPARQTTGSWFAAAVLVVIIALAVVYMFKDRWIGSAEKVETRATATDAPLATKTPPPSPAPTTSPAAPEPSPKP